MKRKIAMTILIMTIALFSHFSVYLLTKQHCQSELTEKQNNEESLRQNKVGSIEKELAEETIIATDDQNAYDQIVSRGDKSYAYRDDGSILIYNREVIMYRWTDPLISNAYYQNIIQCFKNYFSEHQYEIDFDGLSKYGFVPEVAAYGFAVYPDTYENYHAYSNYYKVTRLALELALEKYKSGDYGLDMVNAAYHEFIEAKRMLSQYIQSVIPGDL